MRDCCQKVARYTTGLTLQSFVADEKTFDAVIRNLEVIGEATRHLPAELKQQHPEVEWRSIAGFRDVAIHAYPTIDEEVVWDIVQSKVPELLVEVEQILSAIPDDQR
jgi:uncharacterized protein with HEPN domain